MSTSPNTPASLNSPHGSLDDYRITSTRDIGLLLKKLCDRSVLINLNGSDGSVVSTTIWSVDTERQIIGFNIDSEDPALQALVECQEAAIVGYLDSVKLQFDANDLVLVRGERTSILNSTWPREMFRFQRRGGYRVSPLLRGSRTALVQHQPLGPGPVSLRLLDVSIGGCALFLPDDLARIAPGSVLSQAKIDLDANTRLTADLRVQHVTSLNADAKGVRLGCEFVNADIAVLHALQRFIDLTQKRGRLLSGR